MILSCFLIKTHSLISSAQYSFLRKHSTTTNLLEAVNGWTSSLECRRSIKILYIDFAKAFDVVLIPKLLLKLCSFGICGNLLSCLRSFLTARHQRVSVGKTLSSPMTVKRGVPQGSVLGPFLFLLFINDLSDIFDPSLASKVFADDLKSYNLDDYRLNPSSAQTALDFLNEWAKTWQFNLSIPKCGSLLLKGINKYEDVYDLEIDNTILPAFKSVTDLGVVIDCELTFSNHISVIVARAKQRSILILKSFQCRDINLLVFAYITYIRPILEYCSVIWSPAKLCDIDLLEGVQRFYPKRLLDL